MHSQVSEVTPWLAGLYVAPEARTLGVGKRLVEAVEAEAGRLGFGRFYLFTFDKGSVLRQARVDGTRASLPGRRSALRAGDARPVIPACAASVRTPRRLGEYPVWERRNVQTRGAGSPEGPAEGPQGTGEMSPGERRRTSRDLPPPSAREQKVRLAGRGWKALRSTGGGWFLLCPRKTFQSYSRPLRYV